MLALRIGKQPIEAPLRIILWLTVIAAGSANVLTLFGQD
jgi:hypothetical protein